MTTYRVYPVQGTALASLVVLDPQPRSPGVQATSVTYGPNGTVTQQGLYVPLIWDVLKDATQVDAILADFGLHTATSRGVTIYARDQRYVWKRYSGVAILPNANWDRYRPRNIEIIVRNLEQL